MPPPDPTELTIEFATPSVWHTELPSGVPVYTGSRAAAMTANLDNYTRGNDGPRTGGWMNIERAEFSFTIYVCDNSRNVYRSDGSQIGTGPIALAIGDDEHDGVNRAPASGWAGDGWPLQHAEIVAEVGEGHLSMWNRDSGEYMECYLYSRSGGTFHYEWWGYIANTRTNKGMQMENADGFRNNFGTTMLGGPMQAAIVTDHEARSAIDAYDDGIFADAVIPHLVAYECWNHDDNEWEYPATRTDWTGTGPIANPQCPHGHNKVSAFGVGGCPNLNNRLTSAIRSGQLLAFKQDFNAFTQTYGGLTGTNLKWARIFASTLQRYGGVNTDLSGKSFSFLFEYDPTPMDIGTPTGQHELGETWLLGMMSWALDNGKVIWPMAGRNLEADGIGTEAGRHRPGPLPRGGRDRSAAADTAAGVGVQVRRLGARYCAPQDGDGLGAPVRRGAADVGVLARLREQRRAAPRPRPDARVVVDDLVPDGDGRDGRIAGMAVAALRRL